MNVDKTIDANTAIIRLEGWLDTNAAPEVEEVIESLPSEVTELYLDLEKMEYISSSGIRLLVAAHKKMNGQLTIQHVSDEIMDVIRMTGLDNRLHFA